MCLKWSNCCHIHEEFPPGVCSHASHKTLELIDEVVKSHGHPVLVLFAADDVVGDLVKPLRPEKLLRLRLRESFGALDILHVPREALDHLLGGLLVCRKSLVGRQ